VKPLALDLACGKGGWSLGLLATGWDVIGVDIEDMGGYPEKAKLVIADILEIAKDPKAFFPGLKFDLVVASPPCQEFSYRSFPFKRCRYLRDNVPPNTDIWRACEKIAKELGAPLILENVRGAVRYIGKPQGKFGPFYLWGDVPVLLPDGKPQKGFGRTPDKSANPSDPWGGFGGSSYQSRGKRGPLNQKRIFAGEYERESGLKHSRPAMTKQRDSYKRVVGSEKYRITHSKDGHKRIGGASDVGAKRSSARKEWSAKAAMIPYELSFHIGDYFHPNGTYRRSK